MNCNNCGREIDSGAKFCQYCGSKVEGNDLNSYNDTYSYDYQYAQPQKKKMNGGLKAVLWIVGIGVGSIIVIGIIIFVAAIVQIVNEDTNSVDTYDEYNIDDEDSLDKIDPKNDEQSDENRGGIGFDSDIFKNDDDEKNEPVHTVDGETQKSVNLLTFALSFDDVKMDLDALDWYDFIYGEGYYDYGSVDDYYRESSKGMFSFVPANETWGTANDGIIDIQMDMNHPSFDFSRSEDDYYEDGFVFYEKVLAAADSYVDFASYDTDGDGYIVPEELTLVFIFAGYETYEGFDPVASTYSCSLIYDYYAEIDGVQIDEVIYTAEKDPYNSEDDPTAGIGVLCHELGHALDLPDLYDTDYSSEGLAFHCLMAGGCDNTSGYQPYGMMPAPLTAWEREFLGFEEPEEIAVSGTYDVYARSQDDYNILKIDAGEGYYLVENVDFNGFGQGLDDPLKSPGIAIWYVNKTVVNNQRRFYQNDVNDNENKYGVMLMEAHETEMLAKSDFDYQRVYDHYYYLGGDSEFTTDEGIQFEILDTPGDVMKVKIILS